MHTIQFDANNNKIAYTLPKHPSLMIDLIHFQTQDPDWTTRLSKSNLKVTMTCLDDSNQNLGVISTPIDHDASAYHRSAYLQYNHKPVIFDLNSFFFEPSKVSSYKIEIELGGMQFNQDENYTIKLHLLEHSNYQVFCAGKTIATVYITDNHPANSNNRVVTFVPVRTIEINESHTHLEFGNHQNLLANIGVSDDVIIQDLFTRGHLTCDRSYTTVKL